MWGFVAIPAFPDCQTVYRTFCERSSPFFRIDASLTTVSNSRLHRFHRMTATPLNEAASVRGEL